MYDSAMQPFDRSPVDVRGPLKGSFQHRQTLTSFARAFVAGDKLFIAESRDLGKTVSRVTAYDVPTEEPKVNGNTMKWGPWVLSGCSTCRAGRSKWKTHTTDSLTALADVEVG